MNKEVCEKNLEGNSSTSFIKNKRKIRSLNDNGEISSTEANKESQSYILDITTNFQQLCYEGSVKPGMIVDFKNFNFEPIKLDEEMTGSKQEVKGRITNGIVVRDNNQKYTIIAFLETSKPLVLFGRYGRAYGVSTIQYIISKIFGKEYAHFLQNQEFIELCVEGNDLLIDFYAGMFAGKVLYFQHYLDDKMLYSLKLKEERYFSYITPEDQNILSISPGKEISVQFLGVSIKDVQCSLRENKACLSCWNYSYSDNPYDLHIEVKGVCKNG